MEHVARRKRLKKAAAKRLEVPASTLGWVNGILVLLATKMPVDGTPAVPKPGYRIAKPVAVRPSYQPPPRSPRHSSFDYRYN